jgi:hypothetical protein
MEGGNPLSTIPLVTITPKGIFKYVLITAHAEHNGHKSSLDFVRGSDKREYHQENFEDFLEEVKSKGFVIKKKNLNRGDFTAEHGQMKVNFKCPGGGRIEHNYEGKKCHIYGYSKSFGKVDHTIAQALIS